MAGRNYGLTRPALTCCRSWCRPRCRRFSPACKIGWAFAWRTLIAAELVFGASLGARRAGLVHLPEPQRALHGPGVRGAAAVIVIGLVVENVVFDTLERVTVRRWGVQH